MGDTLAQDCFAMSEPFFGPYQFRLKLLEISSTKIFEFATFEQIPHAFLRIKFRGIPRQAFQVDAFGSAIGQKIFDGLRAMNARPIPDDQELASYLAQQQLQEPHHIRSFERVVLNVHEQATVQSEAAESREMIASQGNLQDRRLSHWGVGAHDHGQQVKACFIYKDDCALLLVGLFFSSTEW